MKKFSLYICVAVMAAALFSCLRDSEEFTLPQSGEELSVKFTVQVPGTSGAPTRAMTVDEESQISTVDVLAFVKDGNGDYRYTYTATDVSKSENGTDVTVTAKVKVYDREQQFVVFVNASDELSAAGIIRSEKLTDAVRKIVSSAGGGEWPARNNSSGTFKPIPMYAKTTAQVITNTTNTIGTFPLLRMLARIDVRLAGAVDNFVLVNASLFNYKTAGYVAHDFSNMSGSTAQTPAVPTAGDHTGSPILQPTVFYQADVTNDPKGEIVRSVYTFESPAITTEEGKLTGTALVIGGYYGGNTSKLLYYRVDIKTTDDNTQNISSGILRNHHYKVEIQSVAGPGADSAIEAYEGADPINFTVTVTDWGADWEVPFPFPKRSSNCFIATTGGPDVSIPVYSQIFWAIQAGDLPWNWMTTDMTLGTEIVWAEDTDNIAGLRFEGIEYNKRKKLLVTPGTVEGNAVVGIYNDANKNGVRDSDEGYLWSWHIWVTNDDISTVYDAMQGFAWMDRNLGASRTIAQGWEGAISTIGDPVIGMYYQWGRKDPFPKTDTFYDSSGALSAIDQTDNTINTMANSVTSPLRFITTWTGSSGASSWDPTGKNKSVYDPCPEGWRIPVLVSFPPSGYNTYSGRVIKLVPTDEVLPPCRARWGNDAHIAEDSEGLPIGIYNFGNSTNSRLSWNYWGSSWEINTSYNNRAGTVRCVSDGSAPGVVTPTLSTDSDGRKILTDGATYTVQVTSNTEWTATIKRGTNLVTTGDADVLGLPLIDESTGFDGGAANSYVNGDGNGTLTLTTIDYINLGKFGDGSIVILFRDKATGELINQTTITVWDGIRWARSNIVMYIDARGNKMLTFAEKPADHINRKSVTYYDAVSQTNITNTVPAIPTNVHGLQFRWGSLMGVTGDGTHETQFNTGVTGLAPSHIVFWPTEYEDAGNVPATAWTWGGVPYINSSEIGVNSISGTEREKYDAFLGYPNGTGKGFDKTEGKGDICRYITDMGWVEGKWRMPTTAEMRALYNETNTSVMASYEGWKIGDWSTSYYETIPTGENGKSDGTTGGAMYGYYKMANLRIVGAGATNSVSLDNTTDRNVQNLDPAAVVIPAVGYRYASTGVMYTPGCIGINWSATPSVTNDYGYALSYSYANNASPVNSNPRTRGFSIRCIRDLD